MPNIIPEKAELWYIIRAPKMSELSVAKEKVSACLKAAATATGCTVSSVTFPNI